MFFGVMGFTHATAFIGSILKGIDDAKEEAFQKTNVLNRMRRKYKRMSTGLYEVIEKNLLYQTKNNWLKEKEILDHCNANLQKNVLLVMYKDSYTKVKFLLKQEKNLNFITWICPQLAYLIIMKKETIFQEGDPVTAVFFLHSGSAAYVMARFNNAKYIEIEEGDHFGEIDIVLKNEEMRLDTI